MFSGWHCSWFVGLPLRTFIVEIVSINIDFFKKCDEKLEFLDFGFDAVFLCGFESIVECFVECVFEHVFERDFERFFKRVFGCVFE